jgi:hypothetical protein
VLGLASGERLAIACARADASQRIEAFRFADGTTLGWDAMTMPASLAVTADLAAREEGTATEGIALYSFTVTRSGNAGGPASLAWSVAGIGARPADAQDFLDGRLPGGRLDFAAGVTAQTIKVRVVKDAAVEPDEAFAVRLDDAFGASIAGGVATATIRNDDWAPRWLGITCAAANRAEGTGTVSTACRFTVTRTGELARPSEASWTVSGAGPRPADATDFAGGVLPSGRIAFAPGEATRQIVVQVAPDSLPEDHEGFSVRLGAPVGATILDAVATGVIRNDDVPATFLSVAALDADHAEGTAANGGSVFGFVVTRSGQLGGTSRAAWSVIGGGPHPVDAADFVGGVLPAGTISLLAGETSRTLNIRVARDSVAKASEGFVLHLSCPVGATLAEASAIGAIRNDDPWPVPASDLHLLG